MVNDEVNNKAINIEIKVAQYSAKAILKAMKKIIEDAAEKSQPLADYLSEKRKTNSRKLKDMVKKGQLEYINNLLENHYNKLLFICSLSNKWYGNGNEGWTFYYNIYSKYVTDEEVYNSIYSWGKYNLDKFTKEEQTKLASFVLFYKSENDDNINITDANNLVQNWISGSY